MCRGLGPLDGVDVVVHDERSVRVASSFEQAVADAKKTLGMVDERLDLGLPAEMSTPVSDACASALDKVLGGSGVRAVAVCRFEDDALCVVDAAHMTRIDDFGPHRQLGGRALVTDANTVGYVVDDPVRNLVRLDSLASLDADMLACIEGTDVPVHVVRGTGEREGALFAVSDADLVAVSDGVEVEGQGTLQGSLFRIREDALRPARPFDVALCALRGKVMPRESVAHETPVETRVGAPDRSSARARPFGAYANAVSARRGGLLS